MKWILEKRNIKDLIPYSKNPRKLSKHDYENLKKSLDHFGLIDKPIINQDGTIIGGHQRLEVLKKSKVKEIECYVPEVSLTKEEERELNIRLNRNVGEWDFDVLANQWDLQELLEFGFTQDELSFDLETVVPPEEEDVDIKPIENPVTQLGDIYELGNHRLICGDSTNPDVVSKLLGDEIPILMVTDPPYGVEYDPSWRKCIKHQKGKPLALGVVENDSQANWSLAWLLFPGSVAYVWASALHTLEVVKSLIDSGFQIISQIIWVKQHFALSRGDYHWQHEPCWYVVKNNNSHNWQGSRNQSTVWEIANLGAFGKNIDDERTAHSTQKPLECMARPILNNTCSGEGVYDPFLGSGTTLIASEQYDRVCYGIELSPSYCDLIVKRWISYRNKLGKDTIVKRNGELFKELN